MLFAAMLLCGCLSDPQSLPPFDGALPVADAPLTADAHTTDAVIADAASVDAVMTDAAGLDAESPDALVLDAVPSTNTHSVLFTPADDSYLSAVDQAPGLDVVNALTFEAWVKLASLPASGTRYSIVVKSDNGAVQDSYSFAIQHEGGAGYRMTGRVNGTASSSPERDGVGWDWSTIAVDTWYHLAVTYDLAQSGVLNRFRFYLDGTEVTGGLLLLNGNLDTIRDSTAPVVIGARVTTGVGTSNHFDGQIDDVRIWSVVRSQGDIAANRAVELTGSESGLLGYWKLNNGLLDEGPNGNNLAVTGSPAPAFVSDKPF